jgi:hypothetical protein
VAVAVRVLLAVRLVEQLQVMAVMELHQAFQAHL